MRISNRKGFSLLELSSMLLILAIAVPPILASFNYVMRSTAMEEITTVSTFLAQDRIERVLSRPYFNMAGEDTAGGWVNFPSPFSDYQYFVQTKYMNPAVGGVSMNLNNATYELASGMSNYLRIIAKVRHINFQNRQVQLTTLATYNGSTQ
ncbi:MAG: hypothetical protein AB1629_03105 [Candidatus Omnitrophota bacterium]